jgi:hypothetical protein
MEDLLLAFSQSRFRSKTIYHFSLSKKASFKSQFDSFMELGEQVGKKLWVSDNWYYEYKE